MAEVEAFSVMEIFTNVVAQSVPYCGVCLRSGPSVKLVAPSSLTELITVLGLRIFQPVSSTIPHACLICERQAAAALRAHAALRCAARVHALFSELRRAKSQFAIRRYQDHTLRTAQQCDKLLKEVRCRTRLVQTEVLIVDSTGVCSGGHHTQTQQRVIGEQPFKKIDVSSASTIETVILDDDEDPLSVTPVTPAGFTGVPLLQLTPLVSLYNGSNVIYLQNPAQQNNFVVNNNINNKQDDNMIVVIENNCSVDKNPSNITNCIDEILKDKADELNGRKRARLGGPEAAGGQQTYVVNIDDVTDMINEQSKKEQKKCELERHSAPRVTPVPAPEPEPAPAAERPARRIDWEDKIPMDVISFMDATDPNAAELIVPDQTEKQKGSKRGSQGRPAGPGPPVIDLC